MRTIDLTKGQIALISDEDWELVRDFRWQAVQKRKGGSFYAYSDKLAMHRLIAKAPPDMYVDHIDGYTLDNRRENLRVVTNDRNLQNRGLNTNNKSGYKGVSASKERWQAHIWNGGVHVRLGVFDTKEEAARAYDEAARRLHGQYAYLNFK